MESEYLPKISVVTPSYNQGKYLEDAIRSVLIQAYPNFEHIIIDNCSDDETLAIIKKYSHLKWVSEPDKGQSDALNRGFKAATGDFIGWLNADDYYLPGTFTNVTEAFSNYPEADLIYGNWNFVDTAGKIIKRFQSVPFNLRAIIYYGPYIGSTALFFKRELIAQGLFINEKFRYAMDWEWYARLGSFGKKFIFINQTFAGFRIHGENQSQKYQNMKDINKYFTRARQLAEGYAIKRYYGHHWGKDDFGGNILEEISYRILWRYYRIKVLLIKLFYLAKGD